MTKKFCDRCGRELKPRDDYAFISIKTTQSSYYSEYDLCTDCLEKFREFMKNLKPASLLEPWN